MQNCAERQSLSPQEEQKIRQEIGADEKISRIESIIRGKVRAGFNGSVLIAQRGVVLYQSAFGLAHFERSERDSLLLDSKFQLASLSKTFTAVATLKLVDAGKVKLTDSVQRFIPDFPYHGIQVSDLLSHRSGLPNYAYAFDDSMKRNFYNRQKPYPNNETILRWLATVSPKVPRYNVPGRGFSYSNTNYMVLASIIERASGEPFEQFLKKNIFDPLGMNNTFVATTRNDSINIHKTAGYQWNRRIPKDYYDDVVGDKGIYSTVGDLFKWYLALNGDCLMRKNVLAEAFLPRSFERKGTRNYGYGFRMHVNDQNKPEYIYHTGWWKGYNSMFWFSPKDDFVIILLSNRYNKSVYNIKELLEVLHGHPTQASPDAENGEVEI
ncbi:serine hydrolase domain-containing protein [Tellurirhabdus rosea]|uniref:serine hydrolase domain-containing protein n=1 Tax=Tellurirhabdus rosea TaxID=2674997 RepID=UPI002254171F|nr:serine hydrolase domain-containing protein [Tellurirhabdus rosea]